MNGGGGVGAGKISLRLQYYVLLAGVGAVLLVGCLKYMPAAAVVAAGYGSWGSGLAVASRAAEPEASPVVIFNFGDSNSDTGGMAAASGLNIALPEGRTYFRRPTGRLSDGRLVIDFICESHPPSFPASLLGPIFMSSTVVFPKLLAETENQNEIHGF
uniref:GDSL esterase/lipase n=1 Tax=Aegilops tauschii subsp. strangulata TaxID=200361 RepID=A0A453MX44_AEGTS